jgi:hypothetical protein
MWAAESMKTRGLAKSSAHVDETACARAVDGSALASAFSARSNSFHETYRQYAGTTAHHLAATPIYPITAKSHHSANPDPDGT